MQKYKKHDIYHANNEYKKEYVAKTYSFLYKYDDNAVFSKTYVANLSKKLFSCKDANKLLFYFEDLK